MTSNDTCITIDIADLIISEGLSFNLSQKSRYKKILNLAKEIPQTYIPPNIKVIYK